MIQDILLHIYTLKSMSLLFLAAFIAGLTAILPALWQILILATLLSGILIIIFIQHPERAVYLLIVFIPLEEFLEKWIPRGFLYEGVRFGGEALLLLIFTIILIEKIRQGHWRRTPIDIPLLVFLATVSISAIINRSSLWVAILGIRPLIRYITVFYIVTQLGTTQRFFERCFSLSMVMATLVAFIGLMQTLVGSQLTNFLIPGDVVVGSTVARAGLRHIVVPRTYIFSTMGRYDTLGTFLMLFLLLAIGAFAFGNKRWRKKILPFLVVGLPAIVLTFSRQSWLGLIIGVGIMALIAKRRELQRIRLLYLFGLMLAPIIIVWGISSAQYFGAVAGSEISVIDRVLEPFSQRYFEVSRYSYGRLFVIFEVSSRLLQTAPFFGLGPGQFGSLTTRFFGIDFWDIIGVPENAAHFINDVNWVVILGQVGIIGVLAFLWMFWKLLKTAHKRYKTAKEDIFRGITLAYTASVIVYLLIGFFGPNFEVRQISFYVWLFGGLIVGLRGSMPLEIH